VPNGIGCSALLCGDFMIDKDKLSDFVSDILWHWVGDGDGCSVGDIKVCNITIDVILMYLEAHEKGDKFQSPNVGLLFSALETSDYQDVLRAIRDNRF
jgi:hypothetical protein